LGGISEAGLQPNIDEVVKSQKNSLSLDGRGRGEGEEGSHFRHLFIPLPFAPFREGRWNSTFYDFINIG
jgi:hypothetical protein